MAKGLGHLAAATVFNTDKENLAMRKSFYWFLSISTPQQHNPAAVSEPTLRYLHLILLLNGNIVPGQPPTNHRRKHQKQAGYPQRLQPELPIPNA